MTAQPRAVLIDTNRYIGIPYVWGGRDIKTGLDCYGLVLTVLKDLGVNALPDFDCGSMLEAYRMMMQQKKAKAWEPTNGDVGDVVTLGPVDVVHHIGVKVRDGVLHTTAMTGSVIQSIRQVRMLTGMPHARYYRWVG